MFLKQSYRELQGENDTLKAENISSKKARTTKAPKKDHTELAFRQFSGDLDRAGKMYSVMYAPWADSSLWQCTGLDDSKEDEDLSEKELDFKDILICVPNSLHEKLGDHIIQRFVC